MIDIEFWDFYSFVDTVNLYVSIDGCEVEQLYAQMMGWA